MSFNKIRLELARDHDFPDGSSERGYEFTAPLTNDGRISESEWKANRPAAACGASGAAMRMRSVISFASPEGLGRFITTCLAILTTTRAGTASAITGLSLENTFRSRSMTMSRTFRVMMVQPLE